MAAWSDKRTWQARRDVEQLHAAGLAGRRVWECRECGQLNSPDESLCMACGVERRKP